MDFYDIYQSKKHRHGTVLKRQLKSFLMKFDLDRISFEGISLRYIGRKLGIRTLANFLILYSIYMIGWVFYEPVKAELRYRYENVTGKHYVVAEPHKKGTQATPSAQVKNQDQGQLSKTLKNAQVIPLIPQDPNFSLIIPKLGANARIIKNVNSADEKAYMKALRSGVAHAAGTSLPGMGRHIYLFAHSTNTYANVNRYNAIFYLLYKLESGDEVDVFYEGVRYRYTVTDKKIVKPTDVHYLTQETDTETLIMQTCWPPGTVSERMLVFARPSSEVALR